LDVIVLIFSDLPDPFTNVKLAHVLLYLIYNRYLVFLYTINCCWQYLL